MLRTLARDQQPAFLTTYTRNPSILRMVQTVSESVYPLNPDDAELHELARRVEHASQRDVVYHIDRYGPGGLFGDGDPADRPLHPGGRPLKQQFSELTSVRNALVVVARTRRQS